VHPQPGFNLLSEILFVQATRHFWWWRVRWCFNLLSEILFVQAPPDAAPPRRHPRFQSLERDSVCSSGDHVLLRLHKTDRFNLLSEILFVQAARYLRDHLGWALFQSLERDSVCSSKIPRDSLYVFPVVSIS